MNMSAQSQKSSGHWQQIGYQTSPNLQHRHRSSNDQSIMAVSALLNHEIPAERDAVLDLSSQRVIPHHNSEPSRHRPALQISWGVPSPPSSRSSLPPLRPSVQARRNSRPDYTEEQTIFIWYQRIDLGREWSVLFPAITSSHTAI